MTTTPTPHTTGPHAWEQTTPTAATLAELRRTRGKEPFTTLSAIRHTRTHIPDKIAARGDTTPLARAEWATLGLWASHQKAGEPPVHLRHHTLGDALRTLKNTPGREAVADRLLTRILSSTTTAEATHHIGRAIPLLKQHKIRVDYTDLMWGLTRADTDPTKWAKTVRAWALAYNRPAQPSTTGGGEVNEKADYRR